MSLRCIDWHAEYNNVMVVRTYINYNYFRLSFVIIILFSSIRAAAAVVRNCLEEDATYIAAYLTKVSIRTVAIINLIIPFGSAR